MNAYRSDPLAFVGSAWVILLLTLPGVSALDVESSFGTFRCGAGGRIFAWGVSVKIGSFGSAERGPLALVDGAGEFVRHFSAARMEMVRALVWPCDTS